MIILIIIGLPLVSLAFIFYMWKKDIRRKEQEHKRIMERLSRLVEVLRKKEGELQDDV